MKGHVTKKGNKWYIKLDVERDPITGERKTKWFSGFDTRKAAEKELAKLIHQLDTGTYIEPTELSIGEYLRTWLKDYAEQHVSGKTFERYTQIVENNLVPMIGSIMLPKLQPLHIQGMYSKQLNSGRANGKGGLSPQTVLHHHRLLRKALAQAVRWNLLLANPADRVEPPRVRAKEVQPIDEVRSVWLMEMAQGTRLYLPIMMALYTGMRRGEILALQWDDVDLESAHLFVRRALEFTKANGCVFKEPKSRRGRRPISLSPTLISALKDQLVKQAEYKRTLAAAYRDHHLVVCREDGEIWKPPAFDSSYRQLLLRRKLDGPTFHALRHSHASHLLRNGVDPKVISERLGHSKVSFTLDQYVHLLPGMQEEAASKIESAMNAARAKIQPKHLA